MFGLGSDAHASGPNPSPKLTEVVFSVGSRNFDMVARAAKASVSQFSDIILASHVQLKIRNGESVTEYECRTFSMHLKDSFSSCEIDSPHQTLTVDVENSMITIFPGT